MFQRRPRYDVAGEHGVLSSVVGVVACLRRAHVLLLLLLLLLLLVLLLLLQMVATFSFRRVLIWIARHVKALPSSIFNHGNV